MEKKLMLGNEAIARGAYEAAVRLVAAYPGTPSTEITEAAAQYSEIYAQWSPNEKVALEVGIGASIGGGRAMVCMKHVGLNVAADPLMTITYTGVNGGLVIVVADDPGMHSSQNEQDTRFYGRLAKVPVLEPSDTQEAKDFTKLAFVISEEFDTPVILRTTTRISHGSGIVELGKREKIELRPYSKNIGKYVMMPAMARKRHRFVEERRKSLIEYAEVSPLNVIEWGSRDMGIITSGIAYQYAKEAFPHASFLKLGMVYPLPEQKIREFASNVKQAYVVEELEPFITDQLRAWGVPVKGKELFPVCGELSTKIVYNGIMGIENEEKKESIFVEGEDVLPRPPVLCAGCPHRGVFATLKKLKAVVTGDIGCYTLGALAPLSAMDTTICMGASIGNALGMEKVRGEEFGQKVVAVIGDSTFWHSGMTGLLDVVYNKGNVTTLILDNSTTGMTGHQDHPGTGRTLKGESAPMVDLVKLVEALGVRRVKVVDPLNLAEMEKTLQEEMEIAEPSVIIARRPCALLVKQQGEKYRVIQQNCTGCNICLQIGCPALEKMDGKAFINPHQCTGCGLCIQTCRFGAIMKEGEFHG